MGAKRGSRHSCRNTGAGEGGVKVSRYRDVFHGLKYREANMSGGKNNRKCKTCSRTMCLYPEIAEELDACRSWHPKGVVFVREEQAIQ